VQSGQDALELIAVGASVVSLGTVLFTDPAAPARVREELRSEVTARGYGDPLEVRGTANS
jgi:dihydroorotate dehydrogenase (NAD+) catalytic subunit